LASLLYLEKRSLARGERRQLLQADYFILALAHHVSCTETGGVNHVFDTKKKRYIWFLSQAAMMRVKKLMSTTAV